MPGGCGGKPAAGAAERQPKPPMTNLTFSDFHLRLREFIRDQARQLPPDSDPEAEQIFSFLAQSLFDLQFRRNQPYQKYCQARDVTPGKIAHWKQIPALPIRAFKEMAVTSLASAERVFVFNSSGTTEQRPSSHFHDLESLKACEASLLPWFEAHFLAGWPCREKAKVMIPWNMIFLTPPPTLAPHSSLVHMFDTVGRKFGSKHSVFLGEIDPSGAWILNLAQIHRELREAVEARRMICLLGTAFNFVHLLDYLAERKMVFQLPQGSRVLETGGYKGRTRALPKSELHSLIRESLGVGADHIVCEYGMSELSSQAYDRVVPVSSDEIQTDSRDQLRFERGVFQFPPWARAQVISPETGREVGEGETGLIRIFDLANIRSVMAIQTEDLALRRGRGFELIGRATLAEPRGCSLMVA